MYPPSRSPFEYYANNKYSTPFDEESVSDSTSKGCVPVSEVGTQFQHMFPYEYFNRVQSACFNEVYHSDINMVVSAPTGSGKTVVMELAIVRLVQSQLRGNSLHSHVAGTKKVIYMAPIKALCQQIFSQWNEKFTHLGIKCVELTGDSEELHASSLTDVDVVITTPEKWDSMTRKWKEHKTIMSQIALFLIDEVHLLHEDRGATLEAVVSRMNTMRSDQHDGTSLRFIALSATIPNIQDIADWLQVPQRGIKCFGSEYRPVNIDIKVLGFPKSKNDFIFDRNLNYKLYDLIRTHSSDKPALIFCSTRKSAIIAAVQVSKDCPQGFSNPFTRERQHQQILFVASQKAVDKTLMELLKMGIGYHTAGMQLSDRALVEDLFLNGELRVLCATTSLSQGVNFPVIIKSTQFYKTGVGYCEHSALTITQMIGRAGRPQFDDSAVAIVMTQDKDKSKWENLILGKQPIESNLLQHLTEHLNSEIVLGTISDVSVAVTWLKSTYLYKRITKNPKFYNIQPGLSEAQLNAKLTALDDLALYGLVEKSGKSVLPLELGLCMAKYYMEFDTMKTMISMDSNVTMTSLIEVISRAKEFSHLILRTAEKKKLNEINNDKERIKHPQEGKIKTGAMKVNCLIQATLGNIPIDDWSLKQEAQSIFTNANRLCRGMIQCVAVRKHFNALRTAVALSKCLAQKMWEDSPYLIKQLDKIGQVYTSHLISGGISSFEQLAQTDPRRIESLVGRHPPFGSEVKDNLSKLPKFDVQVQQTNRVVANGVELVISCQSMFHAKGSTFNAAYLIAGDADDNLLYYKKFRTDITHNISDKIMVQNPRSPSKQITVMMLNEEFNVTKTIVPKFGPGPLKLPNRAVPVSIPHEESDDWLLTPYTEIIPTKGPLRASTSAPALVPATPKPTTCKHACKDKTACKHECCKKSPSEKSVEKGKATPRRGPLPTIEIPAKRLKKSSQTILTNYFAKCDEQVVPCDTPQKARITSQNVAPFRASIPAEVTMPPKATTNFKFFSPSKINNTCVNAIPNPQKDAAENSASGANTLNKVISSRQQETSAADFFGIAWETPKGNASLERDRVPDVSREYSEFWSTFIE